MTLTKAELADLLFEQVGLNKREAKDMVEGFFEEIRTALERGDSVTEVALACGYDSLSAFIAAFKKQFNCTPGNFLLPT